MNRDAALAVTGGKALPPHRKTALRDILDPRTGEVLDQVIFDALEATEVQIDGFSSQLSFKCRQNRVASVGN